MRRFLGKVCKLPDYCDVLTPQLDSVVNFLSNNTDWEGITKLKIDYNLIELRSNWFLKIEEKQFVTDALQKEHFGVLSPRKYFDYEYDPDEVPYPDA